MNRQFIALAVVLTMVAVFLPTRSQTFTRVATDGRTTRMLIAGSGPVTVVFESGLAGPLEHWGRVQPFVSQFAKTVAYDRAGVGLSDAGPSPRDGRRIAGELHDALNSAGVPPPYVLVGHSLGGPFIRVFAGMYTREVNGMVLVDPTQLVDGDEAETSSLPELTALPATIAQAESSVIPPGIPVTLIDAVGVRDVPFTTAAVRASRAKQWPAVEAESRAYREWVAGIPGARLIPTAQSGHNVPQEQPELVIETIRQVVMEVGTVPDP